MGESWVGTARFNTLCSNLSRSPPKPKSYWDPNFDSVESSKNASLKNRLMHFDKASSWIRMSMASAGALIVGTSNGMTNSRISMHFWALLLIESMFILEALYQRSRTKGTMTKSEWGEIGSFYSKSAFRTDSHLGRKSRLGAAFIRFCAGWVGLGT
jgi:hypothetical protein